MNNLNNNRNNEPQTIGLMEIQDFACKCEASFYELYLKTQEMVDVTKYLAGMDKELYKRDNLEIIALLISISVKCDKLVNELKEQFEFLTNKKEKKSSEKIIGSKQGDKSEVKFIEVFY